VGNLDRDIRRRGDDVVQKDARLVPAVGQLPRNRRAHMHDDWHAVLVGCPKDPPQLIEVLRVVVVRGGISEVEREAAPEVIVLRAPRDLLERVIPEGIDAAEGDEPIRVLRDLLAGPVVLGLHLLVLVLHGAARITPGVGRREHDRLLDAGFVEARDYVACRNGPERLGRRRRRDELGRSRAEEVLVIIRERG
jgi:hypothetical protein